MDPQRGRPAVTAICVFCSSSEQIDRRHVDLAAAVGAAIARRGHALVSGGGRISCMGAVARAAREGGASTYGVIPRALQRVEFADTECTELVVTEDMRERKGEMDRRADAFLVLPGGLGTLEELFEVWTARTLGMHDKPVVVLDPGGVFAPLRAMLDAMVAGGFVRECARDVPVWADSVDAALDACEARGRHVVPTVEEALEAEP